MGALAFTLGAASTDLVLQVVPWREDILAWQYELEDDVDAYHRKDVLVDHILEGLGDMQSEDAQAFPLDGHDGMAFGLDDR